MSALPDVALLERAALNAVPAARVGFDGPFVLRAFLGGTGRANAASSLDPAPDAGLPARVARIAANYARLGLPCRFRSTPLDPPGLAALLAAQGFAERDETVVLAGSASFAQADAAVRVLAAPDEAWMAVVGTVDYQGPARRAEKERSPAMLAVPGAWLLLEEDGVPAAAMSAVVDGPLAGLFDLAVRPEFRRRGLAQRIIGAAAHWAAGLGADMAWAQVAAANTPSLALNAGLGLREVYRYRYWLRDGA